MESAIRERPAILAIRFAQTTLKQGTGGIRRLQQIRLEESDELIARGRSAFEVLAPKLSEFFIGRPTGRVGLAHSRWRIARAVGVIAGVIVVRVSVIRIEVTVKKDARPPVKMMTEKGMPTHRG